jgi:hypothetical protein
MRSSVLAHRMFGVVGGMQMVRVGKMRVMSRLLVIAFAVVARRLAVMVCCLRVVVGRLPVMMRCVL